MKLVDKMTEMLFKKHKSVSEMAELKTGTVLWTSDRDENGIINDKDGNEYYFDSSVAKEFNKLKRKDIVKFIPKRAGKVLVARNVTKA
jgi:hypothetical protein